jgi:hypothetical protein
MSARVGSAHTITGVPASVRAALLEVLVFGADPCGAPHEVQPETQASECEQNDGYH